MTNCPICSRTLISAEISHKDKLIALICPICYPNCKIKRYDLSIWLFIAYFGVFCNILVTSVNGGMMPVLDNGNLTLDSSYTKSHFEYSSDHSINKSYLADNFYLGNFIFSVGDLLMIFGAFFIFIFGCANLINAFRRRKLIKKLINKNLLK